MSSSNVVVLADFRRARTVAPLLDPDHIVTIRVGELSRLALHRYPDGLPETDGAIRIVQAVLDHLANLPEAETHMRAWLAEYLPAHANASLEPWEKGGFYWRKEELGTFIGLTRDEARACRIRTIGAKATRKNRLP